MCRIEFHAPAAAFDRIPHPTPASRHVPDWFKQMPTDYASEQALFDAEPHAYKDHHWRKIEFD